MSSYLQRAEKVQQRIDALAAVSEDTACITRTFGSDAFLKCNCLVKQWMEEAGLQTRTDNIGNVRGRLESRQKNAKTFVIASHIDSVVNAGKYDGPLGVLLGLDLLEQLILRQTELPFHVELIAFCDEEGVRFHTTFLGSKVVAGAFDKSLLSRTDAAGITLQEVISGFGGDGSKLEADAIKPEDWLGYLEFHIEQGPVLYEQHIPVALVTAIAGQSRVEITFTGEAGHAGTVPMYMRRDALCCAAEFILAAEETARSSEGKLVATIGKLHLPYAASNVIPGEVVCSLDLRSADLAVLAAAYRQLQEKCTAICSKRNIRHNWELVQSSGPVTCNAALNRLLAQAISKAGFPVVALVSGAGHDTIPISGIAPATMVFVRCYKGISHNPQEAVELQDIAAAIQAGDLFLQQLTQHYKEL